MHSRADSTCCVARACGSCGARLPLQLQPLPPLPLPLPPLPLPPSTAAQLAGRASWRVERARERDRWGSQGGGVAVCFASGRDGLRTYEILLRYLSAPDHYDLVRIGPDVAFQSVFLPSGPDVRARTRTRQLDQTTGPDPPATSGPAESGPDWTRRRDLVQLWPRRIWSGHRMPLDLDPDLEIRSGRLVRTLSGGRPLVHTTAGCAGSAYASSSQCARSTS
jgi:hypothetical protein